MILDDEILGKLESFMPRDRLITLASSYLNGVIARVGRINALARLADHTGLGREAHDLKSTSGSFGAQRLRRLGEELEDACRETDLAAIATLTASIAAVLPETVESVLRRYPDIELDGAADAQR